MVVKISYHHTTWPLYRQVPGWNPTWGSEIDMEWKGHQFVFNKNIKECDVWIVNNFLREKESTYCAPENTFFLTGEPPMLNVYDEYLYRQFNYLVTAASGLSHPNKILGPVGHQWFIGKSYDDLFENDSVLKEKTKDIAIICSNMQTTPSHKARFEFVEKLKQHFGNRIDLYGRGFNPFEDKWDVLAPYKFAIVLENCSIPYYFTEKIIDSYLALTYPIYYGCTNILDYFPEKSLKVIDQNNLDSSIKSIEQILQDSDQYYEKALPELQNAKNLCLHDYNFFGLIISLIEKMNIDKNTQKQKITFDPKNDPSLFFKMKRKMSNTLYKLKR